MAMKTWHVEAIARVTEKAIQVRYRLGDDEEALIWVPRSVVDCGDNYNAGDMVSEMDVEEWFLKKNDLLPE